MGKARLSSSSSSSGSKFRAGGGGGGATLGASKEIRLVGICVVSWGGGGGTARGAVTIETGGDETGVISSVKVDSLMSLLCDFNASLCLTLEPISVS